MARRHRPDASSRWPATAGWTPSIPTTASAPPTSGAGRWKPGRSTRTSTACAWPTASTAASRTAACPCWNPTAASANGSARARTSPSARQAEEVVKPRAGGPGSARQGAHRPTHRDQPHPPPAGHRAEADRGRTGRGARRRAQQRQAQEPVPGQHEPRNPHAHERRHRHDQPAARHHARRGAARVHRDDPHQRRLAAGHHQRHSRFLQDRGGQARLRGTRPGPAGHRGRGHRTARREGRRPRGSTSPATCSKTCPGSCAAIRAGCGRCSSTSSATPSSSRPRAGCWSTSPSSRKRPATRRFASRFPTRASA